MAATTLLPPVTAVRMTWARTGAFPGDEHSKHSTLLAEAALKQIRDRAENDDLERAYVNSAIATMDACLRNLATIYKGRELNFEENGKLRKAYLESVKENLEFGNKARDFLKSLPSMAVTAGGGVTVIEAIGIDRIPIWALSLLLAGLGYLVNLIVVRKMRRRTQMLYVKEDYDRDLYFEQYVRRVSATLETLYLDLDRIHRNIFKSPYPVDRSAKEITDGLLSGVGTTFCRYMHKHMNEKRITPELWPVCESGNPEATESCRFWSLEQKG